MVILKEFSKSKSSLGRIIANTRPGRASIYLDGEIVLDSSGTAAKTPTVVYNISGGIHTVTFSKAGYNDITIIANVSQGNDYHARAVLDTSKWSYPMMLLDQYPQQVLIDTLQGSLQQQLKLL
jgi:hypothetical protein